MSIGPGFNPPEHPVVFRAAIASEQELERGRRGPSPRWELLQRIFAVVGLVSGFLCFVVPGLLMLPRYRAWRRAERPTPGAAGPVGAVVVWAAVAGAIAAWTSFDVLAGLVFVLGLPPSLVVSARG